MTSIIGTPPSQSGVLCCPPCGGTMWLATCCFNHLDFLGKGRLNNGKDFFLIWYSPILCILVIFCTQLLNGLYCRNHSMIIAQLRYGQSSKNGFPMLDMTSAKLFTCSLKCWLEWPCSCCWLMFVWFKELAFQTWFSPAQDQPSSTFEKQKDSLLVQLLHQTP